MDPETLKRVPAKNRHQIKAAHGIVRSRQEDFSFPLPHVRGRPCRGGVVLVVGGQTCPVEGWGEEGLQNSKTKNVLSFKKTVIFVQKAKNVKTPAKYGYFCKIGMSGLSSFPLGGG